MNSLISIERSRGRLPGLVRESEMSQSVQLLCLSLVVGLLLPVMSWGKDYSDSWAVEVEGGPEVAEVIARKHGFTNRGQVRLFILLTTSTLKCVL